MNTVPDVGSYGVSSGMASNGFEDECAGPSLMSTAGIIVSRIEDEQVYVRDWQVRAAFSGEQSYQKYEEAREHMAFDYNFSDERIIRDGERIDGGDPVLQRQLSQGLSALH